MANIDQVQLPDGSQYHIIDDTSGYATTTYVQDQISTINKNTIGLGNVDNTADINKPVSSPQQAALNGKVDDDIVAYTESDTTATKRYEVGDQFILNGVLLTATAIIAVNDTIVIGTNCDSAESVATQITENANAIVSLRSDITSINQTGTTATQAISSGTYFYLNEVLVRAKTDIASGATFTLNTNYEVKTVGDVLADLNRGSVSVTADGVKTLKTLLQELYASVDTSKITEHSCMKRWSWSGGYSVYNLVYGESNFYRFTSISINGDNAGIVLASNNRSAVYLNGTEDTTTKPDNGLKIVLYY